ncbi:MAG: hypothetical protein ABSG03_41300 [Bryobacteraceae bacterium]|jgi:hypothetical protein
MAIIIHFTREQILAAPLDEEEHAMLVMLAELDLKGEYQLDKHVRPLIAHRIEQIRIKRGRLGLRQYDLIGSADAEAELRAEMDNGI